jgi:uncharacterized protein
MRRIPLLVLALAVALGVLVLVSGFGRSTTARADTVTPPSVTATGHGDVTAVPDVATISLGVHTQAVKAADALAQNSRLAAAVVAALKAAGGTKLQTQQVSLAPVTTQSGRIRGYAADNSISASSSVASVGALVDAAVAAGANTVSGPYLDVSTQDALYRQALAKAVADARVKAQALADAGNFALGPVISVSEGSTAPLPYASAGGAAKTDVTTVEPGVQDVTADVTVTFGIR